MTVKSFELRMAKPVNLFTSSRSFPLWIYYTPQDFVCQPRLRPLRFYVTVKYCNTIKAVFTQFGLFGKRPSASRLTGAKADDIMVKREVMIMTRFDFLLSRPREHYIEKIKNLDAEYEKRGKYIGKRFLKGIHFKPQGDKVFGYYCYYNAFNSRCEYCMA